VGKLKRPEQVNVLCDKEATESLYQQVKQHYKPPNFQPLPHTKCYLIHKQVFQTSHEQQTLLWARPNAAVHKYYKQKYNWADSTYAQINWPSLSSAITGIS
jgi:hypothetical protein